MIVTVAGCLLASALFAGIVLFQAREEAIGTAARDARNLAIMAAGHIARDIALNDLSLQAVARGMELPAPSPFARGLRQTPWFDRPASTSQFGFLNVLDASGEVVADLQSAVPRHGNFASRDYFQALRRDPRDQLFIGRPVLIGSGQQATVPLARRRFGPDGSFAGVVVGSMRLGPIQDSYADLNLARQGRAMLVRTDGTVLMRLPFDPDDVGRPLPEGAPLFRFLSTGVAVGATLDPDRVRRITAFQRVGDLPLVVCVGLAETDILSGWWTLTGGIALAWGMGAGAVLVLVYRLRRLQHEVALAGAAARNAKANQDRVTATASHELRTPLTSLLGYVEMLLVEQPPPAASSHLAAIRAAGKHLELIIDRLFELTGQRIATGSHRAATRLDELIDHCRTIIEPDALDRGVVIKTQISPALPSHLMLDAIQLRMVLVNLLSNAVKYNPKGSITVRVDGSGHRVRFAVADTGPGIPPHKRNRLFREYDRLDADRSVPGWGIGLSTARRMVRTMGGEIGYEDNAGGGSIFWVELPTSEANIPDTVEKPRCVAEQRSLRILLVENNSDHARIARTWLLECGHQVTEARNGEEGFNRILAAEYDLIITDFRMSPLTGLDMAQRIRNLIGPRSEIPILLLSGDSAISRQPGYEDARVTLVLPKPFSREQLTEATRTAMADSCSLRTEQDSTGLLDRARFADFAGSIPERDLDAYLRTLFDRIENLVNLLGHKTRDSEEELCELAHDTASVAGMMGFGALSAALSQFQLLPSEERLRETRLVGIATRTSDVLRAELARRAFPASA
jgi:signal transduction histidine kinase/CheY-like chemotaxis protein